MAAEYIRTYIIITSDIESPTRNCYQNEAEPMGESGEVRKREEMPAVFPAAVRHAAAGKTGKELNAILQKLHRKVSYGGGSNNIVSYSTDAEVVVTSWNRVACFSSLVAGSVTTSV